MSKLRIFLARPTYDGTVQQSSADTVAVATRQHIVITHPPLPSSLMDRGFNVLWAMALEARDKGDATHFAMIHADISARTPHCLDVLADVMEARQADIVSVIVPTKEMNGRTSTAIGDCRDRWHVDRVLTMQEVMRLPETFGMEICGPGAGRLLVNNGLMLIDLRGEWCDHPEMCFDTQNRILRNKEPGKPTQRLVQCVPQDWQFSWDAQELGAKAVATRKVSVIHHSGFGGFRNDVAWGEWEFDREHATAPLPASVRAESKFEPRAPLVAPRMA